MGKSRRPGAEATPASPWLDKHQRWHHLMTAAILGFLLAGQIGLVVWLFFQPAGR